MDENLTSYFDSLDMDYNTKENMEQLAKLIHEKYNEEQLKANPNKPLEFTDWNSLTDSMKYSNFRQARAYFDKLRKTGYDALIEGNGREEVQSFTKDQIEILARDEHDSWYEERIQNGWVYGINKDTEKKISPFMIPYDQLTEKIKDLDRDVVRNIIPLLHSIGLRIYS